MSPRTAKTSPLADARRLSDLLEASQTLGAGLNLRASLATVLERLAEAHGLVSTVVFLKDDGTALRVEAESGQKVRAGTAVTRLYMRPGARFRVVDALVTNFHMPRSSLLILVSAFSGHMLEYWSPEKVTVNGADMPLQQAMINNQLPYWQTPAAIHDASSKRCNSLKMLPSWRICRPG